MFYDEQRNEELIISFRCKCGEVLTFLTDDGNLADNPYVDVTCKCGKYYKRRSSIAQNDGIELDIKGTGNFL